MMKGRDILFSKASDEWETPQWLFELLDDEFYFDCDAAATKRNTKCKEWMTHALSHNWYHFNEVEWHTSKMEVFFLNPPYSQIAVFMKKAYEESLNGAIVVCLIPCRTDTRYWHNYVMQAQEIRFIKGRLQFSNMQNSAPFPSCIVIFDVSQCPLMVAYGFNVPRIGKTIIKPQPLFTDDTHK